MRIILVLQALSLVAGLLDRAVYPQRYRASTAWKDTAATLSTEERREVGRAVRRGTAVTDPALAGPAIDMATDVLHRRPSSWLARIATTLFLAWLLVPVVVVGARGHWGATALLSLPILFFGGLWLFSLRLRKQAALSLAANRAVPQPPRPRETRPRENRPGSGSSPAPTSEGRSDVGRERDVDERRRAVTGSGASGSPPRLLPMLAGGNGIPPNPDAFQLEPKLDGQRVIGITEPAGVILLNRRGGEITDTYPELAGLAEALAPHAAVLDGEMVTFNEKGQTSFQRLQRRMHVRQPTARLLADTPVSFVVFDVLWLDGELLVDRPQSERRTVLDGLGIKGRAWQTAPVLDATPEELMDACRQLGLEGFMAKRLDAPYLPGRRSSAWSKIKCGRRREFVVGGWSTGSGSRESSIGSLALGAYDRRPRRPSAGPPQRLFYVGQAGSGLNEEHDPPPPRLFAEIEVPAPPFVNPPRAPLHWVRPAARGRGRLHRGHRRGHPPATVDQGPPDRCDRRRGDVGRGDSACFGG